MCLAGLSTLTELDISFNELEQATNDMIFGFDNLTALEVLKLGCNARRGVGWAPQVGFAPALRALNLGCTSARAAISVQDLLASALASLTALVLLETAFGGCFTAPLASLLERATALSSSATAACRRPVSRRSRRCWRRSPACASSTSARMSCRAPRSRRSRRRCRA
jgi:hypothetical protein